MVGEFRAEEISEPIGRCDLACNSGKALTPSMLVGVENQAEIGGPSMVTSAVSRCMTLDNFYSAKALQIVLGRQQQYHPAVSHSARSWRHAACCLGCFRSYTMVSMIAWKSVEALGKETS